MEIPAIQGLDPTLLTLEKHAAVGETQQRLRIGVPSEAPNAERRVESITPGDVKARRIGHFGFFREQFQASLWPRAAAMLEGLGAAAPVASTTARAAV